MPVVASYDFADFECGEDDRALELQREWTRSVLKEAFENFASEGQWDACGSHPAWAPKETWMGNNGFWHDAFPVEIEFTPADLVDAFERELRDDDPETRVRLAEWKAAIDLLIVKFGAPRDAKARDR